MKNDKKIPVKKPEGMISLDQLLPGAGGSMFSLARIAMIRAIEIYGGSRPLVDTLPLDKSTTIAFREIAAGKVALGNGQCAKKMEGSIQSDEVQADEALPLER